MNLEHFTAPAAVAQWLWHCTAELEVAGSIPAVAAAFWWGAIQERSCTMDWVHRNEQQRVKITPEFPQSGTPQNQIVILAPTTPEFNLIKP